LAIDTEQFMLDNRHLYANDRVLMLNPFGAD
jgi:hypothetical protein